MDHYTFPHITHISQVLAAIKDAPEFIVAERDRHTIINYMMNSNSTFPSITVPWEDGSDHFDHSSYDVEAAIRRECRGIVFGPDGTVIARRYHKFFNAGEREEVALEKIDFSRPHHILDKLDGSMITPIPICRPGSDTFKKGYTLRWGTKMGITLVAMQVEEWIVDKPNYMDFANESIARGNTPIFEWCSRKQRIVVDYPKDKLVLTALRNNVTGEYYSMDALHELGRIYYIPVVSWLPEEQIVDGEEFIADARTKEDQEGYVVRFDTGHMIKIKGDWYVRIHRAKDSILQEKRVVEMIINEKVDDVLPFLLEHDKKALQGYVDDFTKELARTIDQIWVTYSDAYAQFFGDKKEFALASTNMPHATRSTIFAVWGRTDKSDVGEYVRAYIRKNLGSKTKVDSVRWLWNNHEWANYIAVEDEDESLGI